MPKTVGIIVGMGVGFHPPHQECEAGHGVTVEYARIGATYMDQPRPYDVVIDRISHESNSTALLKKRCWTGHRGTIPSWTRTTVLRRGLATRLAWRRPRRLRCRQA